MAQPIQNKKHCVNNGSGSVISAQCDENIDCKQNCGNSGSGD